MKAVIIKTGEYLCIGKYNILSKNKLGANEQIKREGIKINLKKLINFFEIFFG